MHKKPTDNVHKAIQPKSVSHSPHEYSCVKSSCITDKNQNDSDKHAPNPNIPHKTGTSFAVRVASRHNAHVKHTNPTEQNPCNVNKYSGTWPGRANLPGAHAHTMNARNRIHKPNGRDKDAICFVITSSLRLCFDGALLALYMNVLVAAPSGLSTTSTSPRRLCAGGTACCHGTRTASSHRCGFFRRRYPEMSALRATAPLRANSALRTPLSYTHYSISNHQ